MHAFFLNILVSMMALWTESLNPSWQTGKDEIPPPGTLVEMGGYRLHYLSSGEGPFPVVFFHGAGDVALIWNLVLPEVGRATLAIAVDEHGMGWSEFGHLAHTLQQQAHDTRELLRREAIAGPFILVGHSRGGAVVQQFVKLFREDVAGVVLVDATHPDFMLRYRQKDGSFKWQRPRKRAKDRPVPAIGSQPLGEDQEWRSFPMSRDVSEAYSMFSESDRTLFHWIYNKPFSQPKGLKTYFNEELREMYENRAAYRFGDIPLVVVSAGVKSKQADETYTEEDLIAHSDVLQRDLLNLSTRSRQVIAEESGHKIQIDQPEIVVRAILDLQEQVKMSAAR